LNATARDFQRTEVARVKKLFRIRKTVFMVGLEGRGGQVAIIRPFASPKKGITETTISVGQKARLLLPGFEEGAARPPFTPSAKHVAVPVVGGARPNSQASIPAELQVRALRMKRMKGGRLGGLLQTYVVRNIGIFQHVVGSARGKMLYAFKRAVRLKPELKFVETARWVVAHKYNFYLWDEIRKAFAHSGARR
jgi:hypothetical protein